MSPSPGDRPVVLMLGATSDIARAAATALAEQGYDLLLAGRDRDTLESQGRDLSIRFGAPVRTICFDALDSAGHEEFVRAALAAADEKLAGVVLAFGFLGDQARAQEDVEHARHIIEVNFVAAVGLLVPLANYFEQMGHGFIVAISSVAGDRGRQSNYTYGAAKGALSLFLQGLRNRLHASGVQVLTVKPGLVDTRMTSGLKDRFPKASPEHVGRAIARAIHARKDVVYLPWYWRWIMLIIRLIPEEIFKRLRL